MYGIYKPPLITSASLISIWFLIEYIVDKKTRFNLKNIARNKKILPSDSEIIQKVYEEIHRCENDKDEKDHLINSMNSAFTLSHNNLKSVFNKLNLYNSEKKTIDTQHMLWYPISLKYFFHIITILNLYYYDTLCYRKTFKYNNLVYIHTLTPNNYKSNKVAVIFLGLGGILYPFNKLFRYLLEKDYKIIIPLYGPAQSNLYQDYFYNETLYFKTIYDYLISSNINEITIFAWSLGGLLYRGLHTYIMKKKIKERKNNISLQIKQAFLLETLLGSRGCIDTYFLKKRKVANTISLLDSVINCDCVFKKKKYYMYNRFLGYLFHTVVGFGTANSFNFFTNVEFTEKDKAGYNRYLFLSDNDLIINPHLDKNLITTNFNNECVYYRRGYHGGWPMSKDIIPIMNNIVK